MSYCEIIGFDDNGNAYVEAQFQNAHGAAPRIWDALFNEYLKDPTNPYDSVFLRKDLSGLWNLAYDKCLEMFKRIALASTFDYATIGRSNFNAFAGHLRSFTAYYPSGDRICHLDALADHIESCGAQAIGFQQTSVADDMWWSYDEEKDESVPYNLNTESRHFEIFSEILKDSACRID